MKKNHFIFTLCFLFVVTNLLAQKETVTFVGKKINSMQYVQLSKVVITNHTAEWTDTITYPDTSIILTVGTGIAENIDDNGFGLAPNRPNPFDGYTDVVLQLPDAGALTLDLVDVNGRCIYSMDMSSLQPGQHQFRINVAASGIYFLTARQNGRTSSIKMIAQGAEGGNSIVYAGCQSFLSPAFKSSAKKLIAKSYHYGDVLSYTGYAIVNGEEVASSTIRTEVVVTETVVLPFDVEGDEFVCGTSCAIDIDGNLYHTVQLGTQCWMTQNMRTTRFASGDDIPLEDSKMSFSVPYRYLPGGLESNVAIYGYLYNWSAAMNKQKSSAAVPSGVQGICPEGWHVPSEAEYLLLYDYVESVDEYVCDKSPNSEEPYIAMALSSSEFWASYQNPCSPGYEPEKNNATGFSVVPAGCFYNKAQGVREMAYLWASNERVDSRQDDAKNQTICYGIPFVQNTSAMKDAGYSVRCLRD